MRAKALGLPCPQLSLAGAPGLQGCGQGLRPSGWPLIKRGLGQEPGGQPSPRAFLWGPSQLGGVMKGLGATLPESPHGVQEGLSGPCHFCCCPCCHLLSSWFPSSEGQEDELRTKTLASTPAPHPNLISLQLRD